MSLNRKIFRRLFDENFDNLCRIGFRYTRDQNSARDVVQDVFVEVWSKRKSLKRIDNFPAYLRRSVVNRSLNFVKKQSNYLLERPEDHAEELTANEVNFEGVTELNAIIERTIDCLPERCRLIFIMSRYDEMSYKEIASKLDISTKTIENQISKALKILRISVEKHKKVN